MPRVTRKGQVTIPKKIREEIGIKPGTEVKFKIYNGECVLRKVIKKSPFQKWAGFLKSDKTTDQIIEELRGKVR